MKKTIVGILFLCAILAAIFTYGFQQYQRFVSTPLATGPDGITFTVKPGANLIQISRSLVEQKLTEMPPLYLDLYGRLNGQAKQIKAGQYLVRPATTLPELMQQLIEGKVIEYPFTIVEGVTLREMLNELQLDPHIQVTEVSNDETKLIDALGLTGTNAEGWFLPETYRFPDGTTDLAFLKRAYQHMREVLMQDWQQRADNLPYKRPYDALIMASIIEKETAVPDERGKIAGVFVRRLQKGMRLQTDPTVIYGMGDKFDGNLRKKDLHTDTIYNTYTRFGLPPTPICLPSKESIYAALHPDAGNSLYFVATGKDGRHVFSSNLKDHNRAVRRYQLKK